MVQNCSKITKIIKGNELRLQLAIKLAKHATKQHSYQKLSKKHETKSLEVNNKKKARSKVRKKREKNLEQRIKNLRTKEKLV